MKHFLALCITLCLFFTVSSLSAMDGMFVGLDVEANANTRAGVAIGGGLAAGLDLNQSWTLGLKVLYTHNMDTVSAVEPAALVRLYPLGNHGLFTQVELGTAIFFEDNAAYPAFMGGLGLGWRFNLGSSWYVEPMVRGGYPFLWGACISAGVCFDLN